MPVKQEEKSIRADSIIKLAAIVAAIITAIGGGIAALITNSYQSRMSATTLISQREQAESHLRATLFKDLVAPIIGTKDPDKMSIQRERLLAELLTLNFGEHFEFKPLLMQIYTRLKHEIKSEGESKEARESLRSICRRVSHRQISMLLNQGTDKDKTKVETLAVITNSTPSTPFLSQWCRREAYNHTAIFRESKSITKKICSPLFVEYDIKDWASLSVKLRDAKDPLSQYIQGHLTPDVKKPLKEYDISKPVPDEILKELPDELKKLLEDPGLYERFANVVLTKHIQSLIKGNLQYEDPVRRKRLLLDEAYPQEIREFFPPGKDIYLVSPDKKSIVTIQISEPNWDDQTFKVYVNTASIPPNKAKDIITTKSKQMYQSSCSAVVATSGKNRADVAFELTPFDFPFTDNTLLADGNRFAIVLESANVHAKIVVLKFIWFPKVYFAPRERPINYSEIRKKLGIEVRK